jgi:hypothetical protein
MNRVKGTKTYKEPYVFILGVDRCILGDLVYNKCEYDMYRALNNIHRDKNVKYDTKIDLLRPGVLDFIEFIKKKYKNSCEIYIHSNSDPYWINDVVGPYLQKQFKINKPYFTNANNINNNFQLEKVYNDTIYPMLVKKYKLSSPNINNVVFINKADILLTHKDRQIILPIYEKQQYINIYDKMINLFGKDTFDNEKMLKTYNTLSDQISYFNLINDINEKDEVYRKLISLYNMRVVELTNAKTDTYFSTLITKMKELTDLSDLSKLKDLEKK